MLGQFSMAFGLCENSHPQEGWHKSIMYVVNVDQGIHVGHLHTAGTLHPANSLQYSAFFQFHNP
jgi:hypothetical protein